jgi:hypothetical protein
VASRKSLSEIFRPVGPKLIQSGIAWSSGGSSALTQAIDLSLPIRGIRVVFKGRLVIGTAAFTSVNPEGFLNLISNLTIQGTNSRQKGNLTLWNSDLATAFLYQHMFAYRNGIFTINSGSGETLVPVPTTPFPAVGATGYINSATGTYDWRIVVDFPFHPHEVNAYGKQPLVVPGFLVRNEEWKDSLSILMSFGTQAGAGATGALGVSAGTTTVTFSAYGSGTGTPTIDLYSLPIVMGLDLKDQVLPGVLSRVTTPIATILQSAGTGATLLNMQKQPTPRVLAKFGTSTVAPAFATLSDTNVTTLGILLGGNRNVRNKVDIFAHKLLQPDVYDRDPIQGYNLMEFMESGNPDSAYPGQDIGDGATFQLTGDVTGVANAFGVILQEQMLHLPTGPLYNF